MSAETSKPTLKKLFDTPVITALLGTFLGGVIAFTSSWFVTQTQLHHTDHQNILLARRVAYEAFIRDMKVLAFTTSDLQSAVRADPQGSAAVNASATMQAESTSLVGEYLDVQIDGSTAARSLANRDFTIVHQALVNLAMNDTNPTAYRRAEDVLNQSVIGFINLARGELGTNTS